MITPFKNQLITKMLLNFSDGTLQILYPLPQEQLLSFFNLMRVLQSYNRRPDSAHVPPIHMDLLNQETLPLENECNCRLLVSIALYKVRLVETTGWSKKS